MTKFKCIYCNSENTQKSGHYVDGRQRYRCKDCHHVFGEDTIPKEKLDKVCPYCGSTRMRKAGHNKSGSQRYYCNDCKRKSSDNEVQIFFEEINTDIECPYCHSHKLKKGGHLKSGAQRYICKDCNKYFSDKTEIKKDLGIICPHCGSKDVGTSGVDKGKQRYRCKSCKRRFITDYTPRDFEIHNKICPICGHDKAKSAGHTGAGTKYYKCLQCGHKYREDSKFTHTTEVEKRKIIYLHLNGYTNIKIAQLMNKNERTVTTILQKAEIKEPNLTQEQIKLIVKYGVQLNIEPKYVAPYIPCTIKKCREVISKYPKYKPVKYNVTETERKQDWALLDRFIA